MKLVPGRFFDYLRRGLGRADFSKGSAMTLSRDAGVAPLWRRFSPKRSALHDTVRPGFQPRIQEPPTRILGKVGNRKVGTAWTPGEGAGKGGPIWRVLHLCKVQLIGGKDPDIGGEQSCDFGRSSRSHRPVQHTPDTAEENRNQHLRSSYTPSRFTMPPI